MNVQTYSSSPVLCDTITNADGLGLAAAAAVLFFLGEIAMAMWLWTLFHPAQVVPTEMDMSGVAAAAAKPRGGCVGVDVGVRMWCVGNFVGVGV